jgi:hypothetical protein
MRKREGYQAEQKKERSSLGSWPQATTGEGLLWGERLRWRCALERLRWRELHVKRPN